MAVAAPTAPSEGALSLDQAVGLLSVEPEREEAAPAPAEELAAEPVEPEAESAAEGGEEPVEANPAELEGQPEPEHPAIEPPLFWTAEEKDLFKGLPRDLQQKLAEREETASKAVAKRMQEAADQRKAADQEVQKLADLSKRAGDVLNQAEAALQADGWAEWMQVPDAQWINLLRQDPDQIRPIKEQVDLRKAHLQQLMLAKQEADRAQSAQTFNAYLAAQREELTTLAPHLATDAAKRAEIGKYLMDQGFNPNELNGISARQLTLADKARQWDLAQKAKSSVKPQPKPAPAQAKPVKPAASNPTPPQQRAAQEVASKFARSRSIDDAVALLDKKGYGR